MKHRFDLRGVMIPNDYKWYYDWFGEDSTCPADLKKIMDIFQPGDELEVYINSPGGVIDVGSEIYTMLRSHAEETKIYITGEACSAASIVAMAAHCEMSPTALLMVHCVSSGASGNHNAMEKAAEILRTADEALCNAYIAKAGMAKEEALAMMEHETWLTAQQALDRGLIDKVMFEDDKTPDLLVAGPLFALPTDAQMEKARAMMNQEETPGKTPDVLLLQAKLDFMRLKGELRA